MAAITLRRRGLLALERATYNASSLRWLSAEPNKNNEDNKGTGSDAKIDFGKQNIFARRLEISHSFWRTESA
jgi:hypothetical protein